MAVIGLVNPRRLNAGLVPIPSPLGEPVRAEALDVAGRWAVHQRLDEQSADAARAGNTVRVAPARHDKTLHPTALPNDKFSVRSERGPALAHKGFFRGPRGGKQSHKTLLETVE